MSVGMALVLTWRTLRGEVEGQRFYWLATGLVLALASIAAILHLAHPDRAYDALINLRHAWLSRETWRHVVWRSGRRNVPGKGT